jgi:pyruvate,water dikinase
MIARDFMYLRFQRVDVHFKAEVMTRTLQHELARLAGISRDELVMLTYDELRDWVAAGQRLDRGELATRVANGITYRVEGGRHSWETAEPLTRTIDPSARERARVGLEGTTACVGTAEGRVKHVTNVGDMHDFVEGDILVTPMTTPDVMLAIERAAAIVTDEGGLLCHAAIISRELNKPCVIGVGIATTALADGDEAVVTAVPTRGIVKLL